MGSLTGITELNAGMYDLLSGNKVIIIYLDLSTERSSPLS